LSYLVFDFFFLKNFKGRETEKQFLKKTAIGKKSKRMASSPHTPIRRTRKKPFYSPIGQQLPRLPAINDLPLVEIKSTPSPPRRRPTFRQPPEPLRKTRRPIEEKKLATKYQQLYPIDGRRSMVIENFQDVPKKLIGTGGSAEVYSLRNPYDDKDNLIAVKKLINESASPSLKVWSRISEQCGISRHTLPLLSAWSSTIDDEKTKPEYYFSSPLCKGTLKDFIDSEEPAEILRLVLPEMIDALLCLRENHIYHRDIKPDNIFLCSEGEWILGDFGISVDEKDYVSSVNESGGAGEYMAARDIFGTRDESGQHYTPGYNFSSDVYSLGKVMKKIIHLIPFDEKDPEVELKIETLGILLDSMTNEDFRKRPSLEEIAKQSNYIFTF
jgi:hypothetical protein